MENVPDPIKIALNFVNYWERLGKLSYVQRQPVCTVDCTSSSTYNS